jgi:hypothetical protein
MHATDLIENAPNAPAKLLPVAKRTSGTTFRAHVHFFYFWMEGTQIFK